MLSDLQKHLSDIYQVEPGYDVRDFLITDPGVARMLGGESLTANTEESVLLTQDGDGVALSVYLDSQMLGRLDRDNPMQALKASALNDLWTVVEGISHFNYLVWSAGRDKAVTLLELEMQAEVDKFISTWLMAEDQDRRDFADKLHGWLFDRVRFKPELTDHEHERYKTANDYAARFCHGLMQRLREDCNKTFTELRCFYRLTQTGKISHIHSQAY
ncbi:MAG: hypothetical protein ACE5FV_11125 [Woeseia sp.]